MNAAATHLEHIPTHVPAELVRDYPFVLGATCDENPFDTLVPQGARGSGGVLHAVRVPGQPAGVDISARQGSAAIYQDTEHFSNKDFAPFAKLLGDSWNLLPAETDPPMHALYRAMVNPLFAPRKMQAMDNRVREFARGYIAKFKDRGECEFMSELAFRFPIAVFLELMASAARAHR